MNKNSKSREIEENHKQLKDKMGKKSLTHLSRCSPLQLVDIVATN